MRDPDAASGWPIAEGRERDDKGECSTIMHMYIQLHSIARLPVNFASIHFREFLTSMKIFSAKSGDEMQRTCVCSIH